MSVAKKKRVSKKNKISWRKHVNIQDVENFLEDQRLEERLGKPITEKTDEELFVVDTAPGTVVLTSKQKRRMLLRESLPKCFSMLQPHTEVPDPVAKRNRVRTKEERKSNLVKKKEEERRRKGILKAKELQTLTDQRSYEVKQANAPKGIDFEKDVWDSNHLSTNNLSNQWIENGTKQHTMRGTGKIPKTIPKSIQGKHSVIPAVVPPHPGTSYNPTLADHQALLRQVAEKEEKVIKEEQHLNRVTRGMFKKISPEEKEKSWIVEMSEGLENNTNGKQEEEGEYKAINAPVQNKKKNLKQRRKQKEQQKLLQAKKSAKKEKKKVADIYHLRFLKKQLEKIDKKSESLKSKRLKKKALRELEPKRLSSIKFEEADVEFNMPQDISGSLRNLKKEGSLLTDRFKSLQKRNILQPTTIRNRTHGKIKRFTKPDHKDNWKVTVAGSNNKSR